MLNIQPMQGEDMMKEYLKSADEVFADIGSSANGLTSTEAQTRLEKNGKNKLAEAKKPSVIKKFFAELADPMIIILLIAAAVSAVTSALQNESFTDVFIILAVVLINAVLGVVQESKAEKAIEALQKITAATSKVLRDGRPVTVKSEDLVVGDVVLLEAGDAVPADCRLIEAASLKAEESALTGESVPVTKCAEKLCADGEKDVPLGDRKNMVYMGSSVSYGRGVAVVTAVGMDTEMGKIAGALAAAKDEDTPLQKKLNQLSKILSVLVLGVCVVVFAVDILRIVPNVTFNALLKTFMVAVSLAVAAVPEGLAAVVTIVLSMGVTKMSKRNAVIRKLTAVETLGCTQIICSDKTGTLTQNKMTVVERSSADEKLLATAMAVCSDAKEGENGEAVGEPTECALVNDAISLGLTDSINGYKRIGEAPFDSMRKMMSVVVENGGHIVQFTKGAPDEVLKHCTHYLENGEELPMTEKVREKILAENKRMADKALRVLCAAKKENKEKPANTEPAELENDLCYIGLSGMIDPIRPEVKAAIAECREAGIRPVMITGDHKDTAVAIAKELGIITGASQAITGAELDDISDEDFAERVKDYSVYARVQPEHKVRIVKAWRALGKVTAMTGDGVNDAPSIKNADIGVGMGITGTDVTKNVADMVLADDNFATIVSAVEEGRRIYDNIRKAIQFLLASNLAEVLSVFAASLLGFTILNPVHLLWINLITDCFPALALGMERGEADAMKRPPRDSKDGIFSNGVGAGVAIQGFFIALLTFVSYFVGHFMEAGKWEITESPDGMTMAFLTLSLVELFHAFNMRSRERSVFTIKKQNGWLWGSLLLAFALTSAVIFVPAFATAFGFETISLNEFAVALALAVAIIPLVELEKLIARAINKKKGK